MRPTSTQPALFPTFGRLGALGVALVLGCAGLVQRGELDAWLVGNDVPGRNLVLVAIFVVVATICGVAGTLLFKDRTDAQRLRDLSIRLSPIIPVASLPLLMHWQSWSARPTELLLITLLTGLVVYRTVAAALALGPSGTIAAAGRGEGRLGLPFWLVIGGAVVYAIYFSYFTVLAHHNGHTRSYDLGIFDNLMWNLVHGDLSLHSSPATGPGGSHFGRHATLLAYAIAPIYAVAQRPETLLVLQATLLGLAAIPLFLFARHWFGPKSSVLIALLYLIYAPLHGSNLYDFHFLTLAPFFVFLLAWAIVEDRRWLVVLATLLTLAVREDVALFVALLGAWQIHERSRGRLGYTLLMLGLGYFATMKLVLMPLSASSVSYAALYRELLPAGETGMLGLMRTLITNPLFVLATLVDGKKLEYALTLLVPLCFLPLRWSIGLLFVLPGIAFTLLVPSYEPVIRISFQYTAFWTPALFLAAILNLRKESSVRRSAWLAAIAFTGLICSYQFGAVFQRNTAAGGMLEPYCFATTEIDLARRTARDQLLARIPSDARVAASETVVPHLTGRPFAYTLRHGLHDADWIVVSLVPEARGEHEAVEDPLMTGEFGVASMNEDYALLRRGAPIDANPRLLRWVLSRRTG